MEIRQKGLGFNMTVYVICEQVGSDIYIVGVLSNEDAAEAWCGHSENRYYFAREVDFGVYGYMKNNT